MTDLDKHLQEMATKNWEQFATLMGEDALIAAKTCVLRQRGSSYSQIAIRLAISYEQARYGCKSCDIANPC